MIWWLIMIFVVPVGYTYLFVDPANYYMAAWITLWYWVFFHIVWWVNE